MNIPEAMVILEKENITQSVQMLRRWIRQGKIKAIITSNKKGYQINIDSLNTFIQGKKSTQARDNSANSSSYYRAGYIAGYEEGYSDGVTLTERLWLL